MLLAYAFLVLLFQTLLFASSRSTQNIAETDGTSLYHSGSWALGLVVPEGSQYEDGGNLSWETAKNVTAIVRLPNIDHTDNTIYAIVSAMAEDGSVLQLAAGIYPNMTNWLAYAFAIKNMQAYPQNYTWVLNSSKPEMEPGASVTLSIFLSSNNWDYALEDANTKASVTGKFSSNARPVFKTGDQELFALESYSTSRSAFEHMGSLVLSSLLVDGRRIAKGWYYYGDWDNVHHPLFVVGGLNPPPFLSLQKFNDNTITWSYSEWNFEQPFPPEIILVPIVLVAVLVGIAILVFTFEIRKRALPFR